MKETRHFGTEYGHGRTVSFEFDREDLEKLITLFPPEDGFTKDVRDAMRWIDESEELSKRVR